MLCACRPFPVITWVSTAGILALPERERPRQREGANRMNQSLHHFLSLPSAKAIRTAGVHPSRRPFQGIVAAKELTLCCQRTRTYPAANALHSINPLHGLF